MPDIGDETVEERRPAPSGYHASRTKTFNVPVARLYQAWADAAIRARWLPNPGFTVREAADEQSMRITWIDDSSNVEALFEPKGEGRSQVTVDHTQLSDAADVAGMKAYWGEALDRLQRLLGG
jgi:uncharacterized protein YndB with AHSA1/START domain